MMNNNNEPKIYSYHTFMFPFVFNDKIDQTLKKSLQDNGWNHQKFAIQNVRDYNEFTYFYKFVQTALYDQDIQSSDNKINKSDSSDKSPISEYYEYETQKGIYAIHTKHGNFSLQIDGISLRIFNTGVGILSFNLINDQYEKPDDILIINDFGRRTYPQFLGKGFTAITKQKILPYQVSINLDGKEAICDDFSSYDSVEKLRTKKDRIPSYIHYFLKGFHSPDPIIDDRMFVICLYMNDALVSKMNTFNKCSNEYSYVKNDWWYEYTFVDGDGITCESEIMRKTLIEKSTYDRWIHSGTLYGISRYSFVALTGNWFGKNVLLAHMQTMYFQMFTLLLVYRASVIKFSADVGKATEKIHLIEKLYGNYLQFMNKLFFREITAQEQGIELYNKAMEIMQIEKNIKDLDDEIAELFHYNDMIQQTQLNKHMARLSEWGIPLMLMGLVAGIFGMNTIEFDPKGMTSIDSYVNWGTVSLVMIVLIGIISLSWKQIKVRIGKSFKKQGVK